MTVEARIESLSEKHATLDEDVRRVEATGLPQNPGMIREMKARKLRLKDEIANLRTNH